MKKIRKTLLKLLIATIVLQSLAACAKPVDNDSSSSSSSSVITSNICHYL